MPMRYTCNDHTHWQGTHLRDLWGHLGSDHPGLTPDRAREQGIIVRTVSTQAEAQAARRGEAHVNWRRFGCRSCGCEVTTTDDARAPYCDGHLAGGLIK